MPESSLLTYYAARAREYERIYDKPERQADLRRLERWLPAQFGGARVLEIACGTGWWTRFIAPAAREVLALDAAPETLEIARTRVECDNVRFVIGDAYRLPVEPGRLDAAFAGFWFSHVPRRRRREFLHELNDVLMPGAAVVLLDNLYVEGSSTPIAERDDAGDTWQARTLDDGTRHRVLKNFPAEHELHAAVAGIGHAAAFIRFDYYWVFRYATGDS